jgi:hypothetical protein
VRKFLPTFKWIRIATEILILSLVVLVAIPQAQTALSRSIAWVSTGKLVFSSTAPTISSGFGSTPSIASNNGATTFRVNVGTGGSASTGIIALPTASNGWNCQVYDYTTQNNVTKQTTVTASTITVTNYSPSTTTVATAWPASDILVFTCAAY